MIKGSECIVECLIREGVETVYTVAAENICPLLKSSLEKGIQVVNSKLELSAAFMAVTYSRIKRKPAVLMVTSGPGLISSLSPIAEAIVEGDPIIIFATVPLKDGRTSHMHQLIEDDDQINIVRSITKAQYRIERFEQISLTIPQAFCDVESGKPGPVYLEIPIELLVEEGVFTSYRKKHVAKPRPDSKSVIVVADLLERAEFPVIIAGRGIYLSNAREELIKVAELLCSPITTTIMAKGLVPCDHQLYAGVAAGRTGNTTAQTVLNRSDLVLAIGNRFSEMGTGRYSLEIKGKLVQVNIDPKDIGRAFKPDVFVVSDAKEFLSSLLEELRKRRISQRKDIGSMLSKIWKNELKELEDLYTSDTSETIESYEVIKVLSKLTNRDAIIVGDVGAHRIETFLMPIYFPGSYISTTSYVSMGLAVPGAVAASLAYPHRQVVGIVGDGGFLMTGLEITTAIEYGAKPIIIVFNDSSYKVLRIYERVKYHSDTRELYELPKIEFSRIANALGAKGISIQKKEDLYRSLKEAFDWKKGPVLVDVKINPHGIPIPFQRLYGSKDIRDLH